MSKVPCTDPESEALYLRSCIGVVARPQHDHMGDHESRLDPRDMFVDTNRRVCELLWSRVDAKQAVWKHELKSASQGLADTIDAILSDVGDREQKPGPIADHLRVLARQRRKYEALSRAVAALANGNEEAADEHTLAVASEQTEQRTGEYMEASEAVRAAANEEQLARLEGHNRRTGFLTIDRAIGNLRAKTMTVVGGTTGCIGGDAMIGINRAGIGKLIRLDDLVLKFNGGTLGDGGRQWRTDIATMVRARLDNGAVGLVKLLGAYKSGVKRTYQVSLETGHVLIATADHRFMSSDGWKRLGELLVGDSVFVERSREPTKAAGPKKKKQWYRLKRATYHPHAGRRGVSKPGSGFTVPLHRLVAEANLNGLPTEHFVTMCNQASSAAALKFLDPQVYAVHHVDEDALNNSLSNLEVLTHDEHHQRHLGHALRAIEIPTVLSKIVAIADAGDRPTYDLSLEAPHNFIANGIVVHNSGKSSLMLSMAINQARRGMHVGIVSAEDPEAVWGERLYSHLTDESIADVSDMKVDAAASMASELPLHFALELGRPLKDVLRAVRHLVRKFGCQVIYVDYLQAVHDPQKTDRRNFVSNAAARIKAQCQELGATLVLASQLSRPSKEKPFGEVFTSDLKESGDIENMAEIVMLLWKNGDKDTSLTLGKVAKVKWSAARPRFQIQRNGCGAVTGLVNQQQQPMYGGDPI